MNGIVCKEAIIGSGYRATWLSLSGAIPSQITSALIDRTQVVVSSLAAVSSGNGYYYSDHQLPNTATPYVNEWRAWINSKEWVGRSIIRVIDLRVD
jgi:hypothetical protein